MMNRIAALEPLLPVAAATVGAVVGSFLNVLIHRLPLGQSVVLPASHCPGCQQPIRWRDNVPILSFLLLGGRCRHCRRPIGWRYPLVEAAGAGLAYASLRAFGPSLAGLAAFVFAALLLAITLIDLAHYIIPDVLSLPGIGLGFLAALPGGGVSWLESGLGILAGGGLLYGVAIGYQWLARREGMGGGDIKLLAMIGAFLGWRAIVPVVFLSAVAGALFGLGAMVRQRRGGQTVIPYGPFLSLAALAYLFRPEVRVFLHALWPFLGQWPGL
ncbi:MAG: prepilin peptidase [Thermodesulfobacteriota bacterium]